MKKLKHNKIKNTGLIFEILSRMVVKETIDPDGAQTALKIIKRNFKSNSELLKELKLYQTLGIKTEHDSDELLKLSLEAKTVLDSQKLNEEKYNLIKSIKKNYDLDSFFSTRVSNYTLTAAIYKLLEFEGRDNPEDYLNSKKLVLEHLKGQKEELVEDEIIQSFRNQEPDIRKLGFKIIIERFNEKYRSLGERQRNLLSKYINEDTSKDDFKNYVFKEVNWIVKNLSSKIKLVDDEVLKIKLNETLNLTQEILSAKQLKEEHLNSMLKYYELIEEL